APNGTTTFTGRFGQSCAFAGTVRNEIAAKAIAARITRLNTVMPCLPPAARCSSLLSFRQRACGATAVRQSGRSQMDGEHGVGRRTVLMSAGIGIGAGLMSGLAPAQAESAAGDAAIWSQEYWADKNGVKLNLWRK